MASLFPFIFCLLNPPTPSPQFPLLPVNSLFSKKPHATSPLHPPQLFKNQDVPWKWTSCLKWQYWVSLSERGFFYKADWNDFSPAALSSQPGSTLSGADVTRVGVWAPSCAPHTGSAPRAGTPRDVQHVPCENGSGHGMARPGWLLHVRRLPSLNSHPPPPKTTSIYTYGRNSDYNHNHIFWKCYLVLSNRLGELVQWEIKKKSIPLLL